MSFFAEEEDRCSGFEVRAAHVREELTDNCLLQIQTFNVLKHILNPRYLTEKTEHDSDMKEKNLCYIQNLHPSMQSEGYINYLSGKSRFCFFDCFKLLQ